jgi:GNAT superfamily N-acetyltransferase
MPEIRLAGADDLGFLRTHDRHASPAEREAGNGRGRVELMVAETAPEPLGWLRWGLFWDAVPFMNLLYVVAEHRGRGFGRLLVEEWESRCRAAGHPWVLTSSQSDEQAQHFHRHLGYRDSGTLELPDEAPEILFRKPLS